MVISFIFYGALMADFFAQNSGSASGVMKQEPNFISLFLGELAFGALYTYIFLQWAQIKTFATGARAGLVIGLLIGLGYALIGFGVNNIYNLNAHIADVAISLISGAITGGLIGWVLGKVE